MKSITLEANIHFQRRGRGARRVMETGSDPNGDAPVGRLPRITRLMALAIRFDELIQNGESPTTPNWPALVTSHVPASRRS